MSKFKIAIVDDADMTRISLTMLLEKRLDLEVVYNASSEINLMRRLTETPVDLLITGLCTPKAKMLSRCAKLRAEFPAMKILVLTDHYKKLEAQKLHEMGVNALINKGEKLEELVITVDKILATVSPKIPLS